MCTNSYGGNETKQMPRSLPPPASFGAAAAFAAFGAEEEPPEDEKLGNENDGKENPAPALLEVCFDFPAKLFVFGAVWTIAFFDL